MKLKRSFAVLSVILLLSLLLTSCSFTTIFPGKGEYPSGNQSPSGSLASLDLGIAAISDCLSDHAYYDYDTDEMAVAAMKAYVAATGDKYAAFYTFEEYQKIIAEGNGEFHGIGIQIVATTQEIAGTNYSVYKVINVYNDSPALESGVRVDDLLYAVSVDGVMKTINEIGFDNTLNSVRGEDGTTTTIAVFRKIDGEYQSVTISDIERKQVIARSVTSRISETDPTVGVIRISSFDNTTPDQLIEEIDGLKRKGIEKFIFDLRGNPGGYVSSVCRVLSFFLSKGDVMLSAVDKNGVSEKVYKVDSKAGLTIQEEDIGRYKGIKAAVIVNGNTASAAEIFTANMMYYHIAPVVGEKTFGKGIMQTTYFLGNYGYPGYLKLTTHAYCDPSGWCYHDIGITPDVVKELSEEAKGTNLYLLAEADDAQFLEALGQVNQ